MYSYLLLRKFIFIFIFFVGIQQSFSQSSKKLGFLVQPYLQFVTTNSITVMCETTKKSKAILRYGEDANCKQKIIVDERKKIHEVKISSLKSDTQYFYYYEIECGKKKSQIKSEYFSNCTCWG